MTEAFLQIQPAKAGWKPWLVRISLSSIAALLSAFLCCWFFPQQVLTVDSGKIKADALVVLGGDVRDRSERAAELFKTGEAPLIICTGYGDAGAHAAFLTNSE